MKKNIVIGVLVAVVLAMGIWVVVLKSDIKGYCSYIENGSEDIFLSLEKKRSR